MLGHSPPLPLGEGAGVRAGRALTSTSGLRAPLGATPPCGSRPLLPQRTQRYQKNVFTRDSFALDIEPEALVYLQSARRQQSAMALRFALPACCRPAKPG